MAERLARLARRFEALAIYERFETVVIWLLTALIAVVVLAALWNLVTEVFVALVLVGSFDPTDHAVFQSVFGMIFTVIIALEFKRSILVAAERRDGIVQVKVVILLAMLAIVRKFIILDFAETPADKIIGLAVAILALGVVYWLVRDQDRKELRRP
ncbi:MAG: phosphate-starvation-inducible PsiE family protein [Roseicyclus sp.]